MKYFQKNKKVPLGQGMMVCKGWKGGTIKKYPNDKKSLIECFKKKVKQYKKPMGQGLMACKGWKGGAINTKYATVGPRFSVALKCYTKSR